MHQLSLPPNLILSYPFIHSFTFPVIYACDWCENKWCCVHTQIVVAKDLSTVFTSQKVLLVFFWLNTVAVTVVAKKKAHIERIEGNLCENVD